MWHRVRLVRSKQGGSKGWFRSILAPLGFSVTLKGEQEHAPELCCRTAKVAFLTWKKILFFFFFYGKTPFPRTICRKGYRRRKKKYTSKSFLFSSFSQSSYKTPNHSSIVLQRKSSQFWGHESNALGAWLCSHPLTFPPKLLTSCLCFLLLSRTYGDFLCTPSLLCPLHRAEC